MIIKSIIFTKCTWVEPGESIILNDFKQDLVNHINKSFTYTFRFYDSAVDPIYFLNLVCNRNHDFSNKEIWKTSDRYGL